MGREVQGLEPRACLKAVLCTSGHHMREPQWAASTASYTQANESPQAGSWRCARALRPDGTVLVLPDASVLYGAKQWHFNNSISDIQSLDMGSNLHVFRSVSGFVNIGQFLNISQ